VRALCLLSHLVCCAGAWSAETGSPGDAHLSPDGLHAAAPVPTLHVSDLFRPHDDPDDHWDLATQYALAHHGRVDLRGVLIDFPKPERPNAPDVIAVAEMNQIAGLSVPVAVGSPKIPAVDAMGDAAGDPDLAGVRVFLDWMRRATAPVVIHVLGSCRDVAIALRLEPALFVDKCRAIYLNAGSGTPDPELARRLEWNVKLDPGSYAAIFDAPCPVYWLPCFEVVRERPAELFRVAEYGSFYRFRQGDLLPSLSPRAQNFFAHMFAAGRFVEIGGVRPVGADRPWLAYLLGPRDEPFLDAQGRLQRNMWCTAGFLHAVGQTVTKAGDIVPLAGAADPVFVFVPVRVTCSPDGVTRWEPGAASPGRLLLRVRDTGAYPAAMTAALKALLRSLP